MRNFILGVVVTLLVLLLGGLAIAMLGFLPTNADSVPPKVERRIAMSALDDSEWHIYYAVRTGIRYTGMPAWNKALSDQDMWKVTAFLSRIEKLPLPVQDYWKKSTGVAPPPVDPKGEENGHHD